MFCNKCGFENKDSARFCKNCGESLNIHSSLRNQKYTHNNNNSKKNNNALIIGVIILIIALIIGGVFLFITNNDSSQNDAPSIQNNDPSTNEIDDSSNTITDSSKSSTEEVSTTNNLKIISGSFSTASLPAKTYITVDVGKEHAGENVKIRVYYYQGGNQLNAGNIVPKTVDSSGQFTMKTANKLNSYPDYAEITLFDANGNVVDTENVNMDPVSGTQTFTS